MLFRVLGVLQIEGDDGRPIDLSRPAHRRLLCLLLAEEGKRISTDRLIEDLWDGSPPATARTALQTHISALRRILPRDTIRTEIGGYALPFDAHVTDQQCFALGVAQARSALECDGWAAATEHAEAALGWWRGRPYSELDGPVIGPTVNRLEELRLEAMEIRAEALVRSGRAADAAAELEGLVVEHPERARLWTQLVIARHQLGRHVEAVRALREVQEVFAQRGLEMGAELRDLEQLVLRHDPQVAAPAERHNLPVALTRFVGRDDERSRTIELLREHRLVTLVGVGGSGKTRLAVEVARVDLGTRAGGCWFVDLAPVEDPDRVASATAGALGLHPHGGSELDQLATAVSDKDVLVVLDNCEHLVSAAAAVARTLVTAGPAVTVLATSRQPLAVPGEVLYEVPPLGVPDERSDRDATLASDAVRLLEDRVRLARPGFQLTDDDVDVVGELCRRLEGVPLAIELAAARARSLELRVISERLDDRFRLLSTDGTETPSRHRTLEAALRWSLDLLHPSERQVLGRLSVFRGGFDLVAAEAVCAGEAIDRTDIVPIVAGLVDKSLVSTTEGPLGRRYRLLEMVRDLATQLLVEEDEAGCRDRHARYFAGRAEALADQLRSAEHTTALEVTRLELDNFDAARTHAERTGDRLLLLRLVAGLMGPLVHAGAFAQALHWLLRPTIDDPDLPAALRARALIEGVEAAVASDFGVAPEIASRAVAAASETVDRPDLNAEARAELLFVLDNRALAEFADADPQILEDAVASGDEWVLGRVKSRLGLHHTYQDSPEGLPLLDEAIEHFRRVGDRSRQAWAMWHRAFSDARLDRHESAEAWAERAIAVARSCGDRMVEVHARSVRNGVLALRRGNNAVDVIRDSIEAFSEIGDQWCLTLWLTNLGIAELDADPTSAGAHLQRAIELANAQGMPAFYVARPADLAASVLVDMGRPASALAVWEAADSLLPPGRAMDPLVVSRRSAREPRARELVGAERVAQIRRRVDRPTRDDVERLVRDELRPG